ncbi:MAG: hypothetical protein GXO78_06570 [Calditrichaeota bacterium]|nr:hypothetical protein [Calditrichota bacterium]
MISKWIAILLLGMLLVASGCSGTRTDGERPAAGAAEKKAIPQPRPEWGIKIDPGKCRIVATIVDVDHNQYDDDSSNPCARTPCVVRLRVDQIVGMGAGFAANIQKGDTLTVQIRVPASTETVEEGEYPLRKGVVIRADLDASPIFGGGVAFFIDQYRVEGAENSP